MICSDVAFEASTYCFSERLRSRIGIDIKVLRGDHNVLYKIWEFGLNHGNMGQRAWSVAGCV
jgi:hypothetical protein